MGKNVVVVGMHRSGTSAITNALRLLGFSLGRADDLTPPRPGNPEGNCEHLRLTRANERVLEAHGGTWHNPPRLAEGWESGPAARELTPRLRAEFHAAYPSGGWVWKDPRACLTLPLWLRVWDETPLAVMVVRHPVAVARSLRSRNGFDLDRALSLWQRYNECALATLDRLPTTACDYDRALADPLRFVRDLRDDLASLGAVADGSVAEAAAVFKPPLRRNLAGERELGSLSDRQLRLWRELNAAAGAPRRVTKQRRRPAGQIAAPRPHDSRPGRRR